MKRIVYLIAAFIIMQTAWGQTPQMFKYQAVARNSDGTVMANTAVEVQVDILQGTTTGSVVFSEIHNATTNAFGLINLEIGSVETVEMQNISWSNGPFFIKISINGTEMGLSQLLSVPYAEYAQSAGNAATADNVFSGNYNDLSNTPAIPTSVSDLINDVGYITDPADNDNDPTNEIQSLSLLANTLSLSNDAESVDLSAYLDNTDAQDLTLASHTLSLTNDATPVDLSGYMDNTDEQTLDLSGSTLSISNGNDIDLLGFLDNTDAQTLTLTGTSLSISNGNNVDLSAIQDGTGTDDQTLSEILEVNTSAGSNNITDLNDPVNAQDAATKAYVDALQAQIDQLRIALAKSNGGELLLTDSTGILIDVDDNVYDIVKIGNQWWMADNLRTRHFSNGDPIPDGTGVNVGTNYTAKYYFVYNDDPANEEDYGLLYTWGAAMNGAATDNSSPGIVQGVCPDGWHMPSLFDNVVLFQNYGDATGSSSGDELRETGTDHWLEPNTTATNESGFTAVGSGVRYNTGSYILLRSRMVYWSSTDYPSDPNDAWYYYITENSDAVTRLTNRKNSAAAVRCVRE